MVTRQKKQHLLEKVISYSYSNLLIYFYLLCFSQKEGGSVINLSAIFGVSERLSTSDRFMQHFSIITSQH